MAEMIPVKTLRELEQLAEKTPAEAKVYCACQSLPDSWVVLHGLRTLLIEEGKGPRDREGDFVILHPEYGLLVIEVKGGKIKHRNGRWSRTLKKTTRGIKDPIEQACEFKHAVLRRLHAHQSWAKMRERLGEKRELARHAALFPNVGDVTVVRGPHIEKEIIGGRSELGTLKDWIEGVYHFGADAQDWVPLESQGIEICKEILCADFSTEPILGFELDETETERLILTHEQFVAARALRTARNLAIAGGAGTGKTVLAFRHARRSAAASLRTLLLCYNRPLADSLGHERKKLVHAGEVLDEHLTVNTFDGFAAWLISQAEGATGDNLREIARADHPGVPDGAELTAIAMEYALGELPASVYDFAVVIVDEGQDFGDAHWRALHDILKRAQRWCIFFDPNQSIYRKARKSPVLMETTVRLDLTRNCRNTDPIHEFAYRFYHGDIDIQSASLQGREVLRLKAPNLDGQAKRLAEKIQHWVNDEDVRPEQVAVLVVQAYQKFNAWQAFERAMTKVKVSASNARHGQRDAVLFDTVRRFKGLEADIVVLWLNSSVTPEELEELDALRYVGCSRAKTVLVLVGNSRDLEDLRAE